MLAVQSVIGRGHFEAAWLTHICVFKQIERNLCRFAKHMQLGQSVG